ncbi:MULTISPECIES: hypothetical protein [unclassified Rhodococcus (in: high G+C Gram-positive bacteria)]|uniref:hypothetical protein n=1 Tax=unclassified Rhodococcus (in: high G+C Gram-positive bacteria) TaxID=192944 RepID=UPI00117A0344|nr:MULTISPECIES: hypothetical protein [unclassified Rhodococcus (in: high G+C Gram-positive bacteria)]
MAYDSSCPTRTKDGTFTFDQLERDETAERPEGAGQPCRDLLFREARELPNSRFYPPDGVRSDDQALRNITQSVNGSMITVSPPRGPSMEVPLGWTLSEASIENLSTVLGHREPEANTDAFTCRGTPRSDGMVVLTVVLCAQSY